jgi:antitoxin (DNA-binding transcriptional repressor) of toxin-antitoxin stability system
MRHMNSSKSGQVGVRELRQSLSVYLVRVKAGETIEVTERGYAVALLTPLPEPTTMLEPLMVAKRVSRPIGDLLALGPPLGTRPSRRASAALDELRRNER